MAAEAKQLGSPLRAYDSVHGRYFDFSEFESIGKEFMTAFSVAFVKSSSTLSPGTAQAYYSAALNFFRWVMKSEYYLESFVSTLREGYRESQPKDWESVLSLWRDYILSRDDVHNNRKYNLIKTLNIVLKKIFGFGVIPKFFLVSVPSRLRPVRPTRTLVEISPVGYEKVEREIVDQILTKTNDKGIELQMRRDFLTTLANENRDVLGTPEKHAEELMRINADRLAAIRKCAEKDFTKWTDWWNRGKQVLEQCDMSFDEIVVSLEAGKQVFPRNKPDISLGRLLRYFADHPQYQGRIIGHSNNLLGQINYQVWRHGGRIVMQAYLFPHLDLTNAVITLILCDTGANVSVAQALTVDCLQSSGNPGYRMIMGNKLRAGGKLIVNELPVQDRVNEVSTIQAVVTYQEISASIRQLASEEHAKLLFLHVSQISEVKGISLTWKRWFRSFLKRHQEISNLPIHSKMIRPSVLMQAEYDKETGIIAAAAIGDHTLRTTRDYVFRYPNKMVWERMIREFQALFQAISIYSIKGAAEKLGLTMAQVNKLFSHACRTGLGVACLNPRGGIQPGSVKGDVCTQLQNCHSCSNRFVIATVENLRDLIVWNKHLENSRRDWEFTRPEKWAKDWLPWLVFTRVIMEQAGRGRTAAQFRRASLLAEAQIISGKVNLPHLW